MFIEIMKNINKTLKGSHVYAKDGNATDLLKKIKAEKEKLIAENEIKQGKIQEAELQDEILFDIPETWVWCKLDDLCYNITDGTHLTPTYTKSGRIFLSAQNIKPFRLCPKNISLFPKKHIEITLKTARRKREIF